MKKKYYYHKTCEKIAEKIGFLNKCADAIQIDADEGFIEYYYTVFDKIDKSETEKNVGASWSPRGINALILFFLCKRTKIGFSDIRNWSLGTHKAFIELEGTFGHQRFTFDNMNNRAIMINGLEDAMEAYKKKAVATG